MDSVAKAGWAGAALPVEYGGSGLCLGDQIIIIEEMARADAPPLDMFMVTRIHAPLTILEWGTEEQKQKYLPGIAAGELWCQAFSEPNAGSDLAALRTSARLDGGDYIINGQKIWSSFSRHARYALLLARTDAEADKRKGITYFLLDMTLPGVDVRPIPQATGNSEFSEIFLNDVRISADDIIGPLNGGWAVAQSTLAAERGVLAFERVERLWCNLTRFLQRSAADHQPWLCDEQKVSELAHLLGALEGERQLIRIFMAADDGAADTSRYPPIIKLTSTDIAQAVADFVVRVSGTAAQLFCRGFEQDGVSPMFDYIFTFGNTISAGTNEVMHNIIAERVLGMPR
jgi:alkylation response protein AidB-like acyl-CoA dehydrogenase